MDSLTAQYLARALDARWRGRRVLAARAERDAPAVIVAVEGAAAVRFPFAPGQPAAIEMEAPPPDGARLAGWTVRGVAAPEDDRRLVITFERAGRFRGSALREAVLEIAFLPNARGAQLSGDVTHVRVGARLPARTAPRPLATADALAMLTASDPELMRYRWMSPAVIAWLREDPAQSPERYAWIATPRAEAPEPVGALFGGTEESAPEPEIAAPLDDRRARAIARMERELLAAREAPALRTAARKLTLEGDAEGAATLHARAASMERALANLPARIAAARTAPPERRAAKAPRAAKQGPRAARSYREYVTSGGLEVRVGRGAASNDALTFHESAPEDVWMHARDAAGAHVVLRWQRDEAPPTRDLVEAAALAAWHSKSRGSALVPVDWTRRRHVRKPRGAPPGMVLVDRVKTINARPSAELERRLRKA